LRAPMCRPETMYKICAAALLCALLSACDDGGTTPPLDAEPEGPLPAGGGLGGASTIDDPDANPPDDSTPVANCPEVTSGFATEVHSFEFGQGQDFGRDEFPERVLGGPQGGGLIQGSLHVTSLGDGGSVVLGFSPRIIVDGEGPDF